MRFAMGSWVRLCRRYRWLVLAVWLLLAAGGAVVGGQIFDRAAVVDELSPQAESKRAQGRLEQLKPEGAVIIAITKDRHPYDPELVASVEAVTRELEPIAKVETLYNSPGGAIGKDNMSTMVRAEIIDPSKQDDIVAALRRIQAPRVLVGGETLAEREFADRAISGAALGESVGLAVLALLLLFILGRSAWLPLASALVTVAVTLLALRGLAELTTVSEFAVNVVTLVGLGLSVDYALLILWRKRQDGRTERACRTVLVSGAVVAIALLGLMLLAEPLLASMAMGGLVAVVLATAVALSLVPAVLPDNPSPIRESTLIGRMAAFAVARPAAVAGLSAAALLLLALPFAGVKLHNSDARALPASSESRQVFEEYLYTFRQRAEPVTVVLEGDSGGEAMRDYLNALNNVDGVARLEQRLEIPAGTTVVDLTPDSEQVAPAVVRAVRAIEAPAPSLVGGAAAEIVDYRDAVLDRLPGMLGVIFAAMLALLYLLTGSLLVPVKALLLNLLSLGATLGVLTMLFKDLDLSTPVLLFVFVFGLSMDYEVFALSRIFEGYRESRDNATAIVDGLTRTGPVLTAAALSLIVVFLGFVLGGLAPMTHLGAGLAIALVIDVTIVRALLLPAVMALIGQFNYWPGYPYGRFLPS